jgi:predicted Zn-ribbon and HTH transcriptional regulator
MSTTQADILRALSQATRPIDVSELAHTLDTADISGLNYMLGNLVRSRQVERHHKGDGILRYSLMEGVVVPPPAPPSSTASARRFSTVERVRALLKEATRPITAADACRALSGEKPEAVKSALYNGVASGEFASVEVPGQQSKTFEIKGRFTATATASASTGEATATATATATPNTEGDGDETAPNAGKPQATDQPAPSASAPPAAQKVSIGKAVRTYIAKVGRAVTIKELQAALPDYRAAAISGSVHQAVKDKRLVSRRIVGSNRAEYSLPPEAGLVAALDQRNSTTDGDSTLIAKLTCALRSAEVARDSYLQAVVGSQPTWQALETNVRLVREALEALQP